MGILKKKTRKISKLPELAEAESLRTGKVAPIDVSSASPAQAELRESDDDAFVMSPACDRDEGMGNTAEDVALGGVDPNGTYDKIIEILAKLDESVLPDFHYERYNSKPYFSGCFFGVISSDIPRRQKVIDVFKLGVEKLDDLNEYECVFYRGFLQGIMQIGGDEEISDMDIRLIQMLEGELDINVRSCLEYSCCEANDVHYFSPSSEALDRLARVALQCKWLAKKCYSQRTYARFKMISGSTETFSFILRSGFYQFSSNNSNHRRHFQEFLKTILQKRNCCYSCLLRKNIANLSGICKKLGLVLA